MAKSARRKAALEKKATFRASVVAATKAARKEAAIKAEAARGKEPAADG